MLNRTLLGLLFLPTAAAALTLSGTVTDDSAQPLAGATVRIQSREPHTLSLVDGSFTLNDPNLVFDPNFPTIVTAGLEGYKIGSAFVSMDGQSDLQLQLAP